MNILVNGAGGFIGSHLVKRLKLEGHYVVGIDLKKPEFEESWADEFYVYDLRRLWQYEQAFCLLPWDEVYQLAADMGGAGYIFTGEHDADVVHNSAMINLNTAELAVKYSAKKVFFSSSACVYPAYNQTRPDNPNCEESSVYPAAPDSDYGWEKLFSERVYSAFARNYGLDIRIARFHNVFGEKGSWNNGKEKAPAAICRKVAEAKNGDAIEVWGDGHQTRSFLYIDECLDGVRRLIDSDYKEPINIGSDELISINDLTRMVIQISGKSLAIKNVPSNALGVRGRCSDNNLIKSVLRWTPSQPLVTGMEKLYLWINTQVNGN